MARMVARVLGRRARILERDGDRGERRRALDLLAAKYPAYRDRPPPGEVIAVVVDRWTSWP